jgi:ribonuclease J
VDGAGRVLGKPQVSAPGLFDGTGDEPAQIAADLARAVGEMSAPMKREDGTLREAARTAVRRSLGRRLRKRPNVEVHLLRV